MIPCFTLTLPVPISVNALYVNRRAKGMKGRMISEKYAAWRCNAEGMLWGQTPLPSFPGPVAVMIAIEEPKRATDLDNKAKCVLDFLVRHQIIAGDDHRYIRALWLQWGKNITGCKVTITEMET